MASASPPAAVAMADEAKLQKIELEDGSWMRGRLENGELQGRVEHFMADGTRRICTYVEGAMHGTQELLDGDGSLLSIMTFEHDQLQGRCELPLEDGGRIIAYIDASVEEQTEADDKQEMEGAKSGGDTAQVTNVEQERARGEQSKESSVEDEEDEEDEEEEEEEEDSMAALPEWLTCQIGAYIYPGQVCALIGRFHGGRLVCGHAGSVAEAEELINAAVVGRGHVALARWSCGCPCVGRQLPVYFGEAVSSTTIAERPLQPDPLEQAMVNVRPSLLPASGEGLFTSKPATAGTIVAFYSGVRVAQDEVDQRDWDETDYTLSVDDDCCVDVPPVYRSLGIYCATLGHKANHSFDQQNAQYEPCWHPRFGPIKCLRLLKDLAAGEEVYVHYDYEVGQILAEYGRAPPTTEPADAPQWFLEQLHRHLKATKVVGSATGPE